VNNWEIIADNLSKAGWSWGFVSAIDSEGRTIWIAVAHCGDGQHFIVHVDETLTAFLELERLSCWNMSSVLSHCSSLDKQSTFFQNSASLNGFKSGGGLFPPPGSSPLPNRRAPESTQRGKRKKEPSSH